MSVIYCACVVLVLERETNLLSLAACLQYCCGEAVGITCLELAAECVGDTVPALCTA